MLVPVPQPYDFVLSTSRYRAFGPDLASAWHDGALYRVVGGREVRIAAAEGGVSVEPGGSAAAAEVRHLLGVSFDLDAFLAFASQDPVLLEIVTRLRGFRPVLAPDPFEALVIAITAQQISLQAAGAIRARLVERFGVRHDVAWAFPTRERMASARAEELVSLGFSARKAEYVVGLARSELDFAALAALGDDEVVEALTAIRGLGRWTADWFLARYLARPRAWPAGDLGVRKAVSAFYAGGLPLSIEEVRTMGERFAPFENLSAQFLLMGARVAA